MKKILLLCASSNSVKNFRIPLIKKLQSEGYRVGVSAFDEDNINVINTLGVDFFCVKTVNRSMNPKHFIDQKKHYKKIIKEYNPDIVMTFVLKPNTIGVNAAHKVGVKNIFSMVEGAGDAFINNSLKWKLIRFVICQWYKRSFKHVKRVFFLNGDDKDEFIQRKLVKKEQCEIVHGVGVDLNRFSHREVENTKTFLMVSRLLKTKGVLDYCECARIVKRKHPEVEFRYLGAEGTVKLEDIKGYIEDGSLNYMGVVQDVKPYVEDCGVFVLPSYYREGLPMSIMEAEAIGRAILTTDNVGCRETIIDGYNGYLVKKNNAEDLAEKAIRLIENPELVKEMGKNSRKFAEENFDSKKINEIIFNIITEKDR